MPQVAGLRHRGTDEEITNGEVRARGNRHAGHARTGKPENFAPELPETD